MTDRRRFKEALNAMSSEERTAFLYLEKQIHEKTKLMASNYDIEKIEKQVRYAIEENTKTSQVYRNMIRELKGYDISVYKQEIEALLQEQDIFLETQMKTFEKNEKRQQEAHEILVSSLGDYLRYISSMVIEIVDLLESLGVHVSDKTRNRLIVPDMIRSPYVGSILSKEVRTEK